MRPAIRPASQLALTLETGIAIHPDNDPEERQEHRLAHHLLFCRARGATGLRLADVVRLTQRPNGYVPSLVQNLLLHRFGTAELGRGLFDCSTAAQAAPHPPEAHLHLGPLNREPT